jgi:hypothetical protein
MNYSLGGYVEERSKSQQNFSSNYQIASFSKTKLVLMICWKVVQTRVPVKWFKSKQLNIPYKDL